MSQNGKIFLNTVVRVGDLFSAGGPQVTAQQGLTQFKQAISKKSTENRLPISQLLLQIAKNGGPTSTWHLRVAVLKIFLHFSRHSKRGGQDVWIYSPPVAYRRWIFEELQGSEKKVLAKLQMEEEIFSPGDKDLMVQALLLALACSQKTQFLLSVPNDHTLAIVKKWFGGNDRNDVLGIAQNLHDGFKKITNFCNSNSLVFSSHPSDRISMRVYNETYGSAWLGGEGILKVVYIAGNFRNAGNSGQLWLCAQTIIHEATHSELRHRKLITWTFHVVFGLMT